MENEIVKVEQKEVVLKNQSPMEAMQIALNNNVDLGKIEKMIELQAKWDAIEAKKAYTQAMAQFKKNPPVIDKNKNVNYTKRDGTITDYNHATLGNVTDKINSSLAEYGFSSGWTTKQDNGQIMVTCTITHKKGHSESTTLSSSPDTSGNKNSIQAIGSAVTYLQRYTLLSLSGLATHDQDDDGNDFEKVGNGHVPKISEEGVKNLEYEMTLREIDETKFFTHFKKITGMHFNVLEDVTEAYYDRVLNEIQKKEPV
jgi:hypothetical protein